MRRKNSSPAGWWRSLALACIVAMGLVTILGSGGGMDGCFLLPCAGAFDHLPPTPTVEPDRTTVQVGGTVAFSVNAPGITEPSYQWSRASVNGPPMAIPGATGATYTLAGANLGDDGATFTATVRGGFSGTQVVVESWPTRLAVSSMPPVVFQDNEFLPAAWSVATFALPPANGPTHGEEQVTSGGNPGPYRSTTIVMPEGPSTLYVFDIFASAAYDPASQGPLYVVDFTQDCLRLPGTLGAGPTLLLEQNGRRYVAGGPTQCEFGTWSNMTSIPGHFGASDFHLVDGPACAAGESCPDFSASGKPIQFGFTNRNQGLAGYAGGSGGFGIDNWKVSVWRP
jgi:hypothetical protein